MFRKFYVNIFNDKIIHTLKNLKIFDYLSSSEMISCQSYKSINTLPDSKKSPDKSGLYIQYPSADGCFFESASHYQSGDHLAI